MCGRFRAAGAKAALAVWEWRVTCTGGQSRYVSVWHLCTQKPVPLFITSRRCVPPFRRSSLRLVPRFRAPFCSSRVSLFPPPGARPTARQAVGEARD